jgi:hypothetical protein
MNCLVELCDSMNIVVTVFYGTQGSCTYASSLGAWATKKVAATENRPNSRPAEEEERRSREQVQFSEAAA